jgi:transposase
MIPIPSGVKVWLATGHTDMRKWFGGLALVVQEVLKRDPHGGHLFIFRGRRSDLIKIIWRSRLGAPAGEACWRSQRRYDGQGGCLFMKRLDRGRFLWPSIAEGVVSISPAQMGYLLSGIDWRMPQETWRPAAAG